MTTHFFGSAERVLTNWRIVSPDAVHVCPNITWPTSIDTFLLALTASAIARRAGRKLHVAFSAVAVELDVRQVDRQAFRAFDRGERCFDAAWNAEVAAVNVDRVTTPSSWTPRASVRMTSRGVTP